MAVAVGVEQRVPISISASPEVLEMHAPLLRLTQSPSYDHKLAEGRLKESNGR
jgi:hypothetical protein